MCNCYCHDYQLRCLRCARLACVNFFTELAIYRARRIETNSRIKARRKARRKK